MSLEMPKFSSGGGLTEEKALKATKKLQEGLLESKRENALAEAEEDIKKGLTKEGAEALIDAIDILAAAGFSEEEILDFINKQTEEISGVEKSSNNNLH